MADLAFDTPPARKKKQKVSELRELRHFARVLRLVWPHRRLLFIALTAMIGMGICLAASIMSLYPILKIIIGKESLPEFTERLVVESRLRANFLFADMADSPLASTVGAKAISISRLHSNSILADQGAHEFDYGIAVDGQPATGRNVITLLSQIANQKKATLTVYRADAKQSADIVLPAMPEPKFYFVWLNDLTQKLASRLPTVENDGTPQSRQQVMKHRLSLLVWVLIAFFVVQVIGNVFRFLGEYYGASIGALILLDLRRQMYGKTLMLPVGFFAREGVSGIMSRYTADTYEVLRALKSVFGKVIREPMRLASGLAIAFVCEPKVTLVLVFLVPVAGILFRKFGKRIRKANVKMLKGYGALIEALKSTLLGIKVVKAYTMEHRERKRYFRVERNILNHQLRIEMISAMSSPVLEVLGMAIGSVAIYWVTMMVMQGHLQEEKLLVLLGAVVLMFDSVRKLSRVYPEIQRANAGAMRIYELIDMPSEFDLAHGTTPAHTPTQRIEFRDITFTYDSSEHPALENVNITIPVGSVVAVVGPNGSGKTTLVSMLMRLYEPQKGRIYWDDTPLDDLKLRSLRQHISYVSQDTVMFADSVLSNIAYGTPHATREQIEDAARQAHADEFIQRLPNGYDTVLGEHGTTLSGGERQRLAIARAILRNAPVLVFDEATSQIDADSEKKIQDAIDRFMPGRTALVIAHRFSTIKSAHRIVVMDRGRVVGYGTHDELVKQLPIYQTLYHTQLQGLQHDA